LKRGWASGKVSLIMRLTNGEFTLMHVSKPKEIILKTCYAMMCCSQLSTICYETIQLFFVSQLLTQSSLLKF